MPEDRIELACQLHDQAMACRAAGNHARAEALGRRALKLLETAVGPRHPDAANVLNHLGGVATDLGQYAKAERLLQRAVRMQFPAGPDVDRIQVQSLSLLATLYRQQGRYAEAEGLINRARGLADKRFGPRGLDVAGLLNDQGMVCKYTGRYVEGGRLYRRALAMAQRILGARNCVTASIYHNLGGLDPVIKSVFSILGRAARHGQPQTHEQCVPRRRSRCGKGNDGGRSNERSCGGNGRGSEGLGLPVASIVLFTSRANSAPRPSRCCSYHSAAAAMSVRASGRISRARLIS